MANLSMSEIDALRNSVNHRVLIAEMGNNIPIIHGIFAQQAFNFAFQPQYDNLLSNMSSGVDSMFSAPTFFGASGRDLAGIMGSGRTAKHSLMTNLAYVETAHFEIQLPLIFIRNRKRMNDADDLIPTIRKMAAMTFPKGTSGGGVSQTAAFEQVISVLPPETQDAVSSSGFFTAPLGYSPVSTTNGIYTIQIGKWFRATKMVCMGADAVINTVYGPSGEIMFLEANFTFQSQQVPTAAEVQAYFLDPTQGIPSESVVTN